MWFSRSGPVVILLCAIAEYKMAMLTFPAQAMQVKASIGHNVTIKNTPHKGERETSIILHITIASGTLIWGFGDLINQLYC